MLDRDDAFLKKNNMTDEELEARGLTHADLDRYERMIPGVKLDPKGIERLHHAIETGALDPGSVSAEAVLKLGGEVVEANNTPYMTRPKTNPKKQ